MKKSSDTNRSWFIVGRWQEFDGEGRANLVRVLALVVFFGVQLIRHQFIDTEDPAASTFHRHSTLVVVAWSLVCLAVLVCLQRKIFPAWLKYFSTAADLTLLTALAQVGGGTQSALVQVYYLVIGLAALRFRVGLVWFATLASMAGYLSLVAGHDKTWFDAEHATPVVQQLVTLVSLAMAGVIAGQVVRKAQAMAHEYADRARAAGGGDE